MLKLWFPLNDPNDIEKNIGLSSITRNEVLNTRGIIVQSNHLNYKHLDNTFEGPLFIFGINDIYAFCDGSFSLSFFVSNIPSSYDDINICKFKLSQNISDTYYVVMTNENDFYIANGEGSQISQRFRTDRALISFVHNPNSDKIFIGKNSFTIRENKNVYDFEMQVFSEDTLCVNDLKVFSNALTDYDIKQMYYGKIFEIGNLTTYDGDGTEYIVDDTGYLIFDNKYNNSYSAETEDQGINILSFDNFLKYDGFLSLTGTTNTSRLIKKGGIRYSDDTNFLGSAYTISIWFKKKECQNNNDFYDIYQLKNSYTENPANIFHDAVMLNGNNVILDLKNNEKYYYNNASHNDNEINNIIIRREGGGRVGPYIILLNGQGFDNNQQISERFDNLPITNESLIVGSSLLSGTTDFIGAIYDFAIYERTLSVDEAIDLYNEGLRKYQDYNYLTFVSSGNSVISFNKVGSSVNLKAATLYYSIDDGFTWEKYTLGSTISLQDGDKVMFRGKNDTLSLKGGLNGGNEVTPPVFYHKFSITGTVECYGDVTSLINGKGGEIYEYNKEYDNQFARFAGLFYNCSGLLSAPSLPSTRLNSYAYWCMFDGCTSLTNAPELPANLMTDFCYAGMFNGCTSLTEAPILNSKNLASGCYKGMFANCSSLTDMPSLPAEGLRFYCYQYMFENCTNLTGITSLNGNVAYTDAYEGNIKANYCYYGMFQGCTSLTTTPELPATALANYCYAYMFSGCTSLTIAPELPATTLTNYCYYSMFQGCTSLTTAPELPATELTDSCYESMFKGCTSLTTAPELRAEVLQQPQIECYREMFYGCSNLNYIKALFLSAPEAKYTEMWVEGVASVGTFVMNYNAEWDPERNRGVDKIPTGWTVQKLTTVSPTEIIESSWIRTDGVTSGSQYQDIYVYENVDLSREYYVTASFTTGYGAYIVNYYDNTDTRIGTEYSQRGANLTNALLHIPEGTTVIKCNFRKSDASACLKNQ